MSQIVPSESPGGRSASLVPFLFGVARRPELPGAGLVRLLGDLGLTPAAARALLLRMRQEGKLASVRQGRGAGYRLAGEYGRRFERVRAGGRPPAPQWPGAFHALLYQVPESRRAFRDALRRSAVQLGYGLLQPGVLVALDDRSEHLPLGEAPPDALLLVTRLPLDERDAARAARVAWDLDALAGTYAAHASALRTALEALPEPPAPDAATLRRYAGLLKAPMVDTLSSPRLPAALFPPGWPLPALWAGIRAVQDVYGGPASRYVADVLGTFAAPAATTLPPTP
ncbi:hypothetical protein ACFFX1_35650 [Dactylosporangium sucinum]|uniref:hypothetical protein n=1 Tax=Dactylosporangium sucinum TaxID=1424081 RepID=UPI00167EBD08|nr:hypothetical protein [Dactylosporangium sucinum]